ncbi:MAG: hypothetical protein JWO25_1129 [Alphaproteobacteria bacterium]|nr:hypothetical protein [Alphaproteobacteria bacterium]MDB5722133.1 hypothetical protein [Alphaproteobacteria bacterium]
MTDRREFLGAGGVLAMGLAAPALAEEGRAPRMPPLSHAFSATVLIGAPLELGLVDGARKRVIPILGGTVTGPRLTGKVLSGGADWQTIRPDGVADISARYTLQAEDGALISVLNPGYRRGPAAVLARIAAGETVDPALYYFRTTPRFEAASDGPHAWLTKSLFVCSAARFAERVELDVFELG